MASAPIEVSIRGPDGSSTQISVQPGTTIAKIMDGDAFKLPPGCHARLVTETAEVLEAESKVWESQVLTLVRYKNVIQASTQKLGQRDELVFVEIAGGTAKISYAAFKDCCNLQEVPGPHK